MSVMNITAQNFKQEVLAHEGTVLLDFWAPWCGPCRMLSPIVDELAQEHPEFKVGKVNVDDNMELASQFQVMNIPTLVVVKDGKVVNKSVGAIPKSKILDLLA